jgi:hypothetical protein
MEPVGPLRCLAMMISALLSVIGIGLAVFVAVVVAFAVDEGDDVGVLFDGAGFAEVGEERLLVAAALLGGAGELREREDGDVQFFGERFEAARDGRDFLGAVLVAAGLAGPMVPADMSCR